MPDTRCVEKSAVESNYTNINPNSKSHKLFLEAHAKQQSEEYDEAMRLYVECIRKYANPHAMCNLGYIYLLCFGYTNYCIKAKMLFECAMNLGDSMGACNLAYLYQFGYG